MKRSLFLAEMKKAGKRRAMDQVLYGGHEKADVPPIARIGFNGQHQAPLGRLAAIEGACARKKRTGLCEEGSVFAHHADLAKKDNGRQAAAAVRHS